MVKEVIPGRKHLTAYQFVENDMRRKVREGHWRPGAMLPNRDSLATEYNVARGTVQRAMQNLIAEGTLRADSRRGTFVAEETATVNSERIRNLALSPAKSTGRNLVAAVVRLGLQSNYPPVLTMMQGISRVLREQQTPYQLITFNTLDYLQGFAEDIDLERNALQAVDSEDIQAAFVWPIGGDATLPYMRRLADKGVHLIFLDRSPDEILGDSVSANNYAGAQEGMEYLLALGHRRIAFLTTDEDVQPVNDRHGAYRNTLQAHGIAYDPELVRTLPNPKVYGQLMKEFVAHYFGLESPPTALFVVNDGIAFDFIHTSQAAGFRVPEDISVLGFDDIEAFQKSSNILTTIQQPFEQIGRKAAELLLSRLRQPNTPVQRFRHVELPTRLVIRSTCAPLNSAHNTVSPSTTDTSDTS